MDGARFVMYGVGALGMCAAMVQSMKKFYNAEEKNAAHTAAAKGFGSFYRFMTMQMNLSREDRMSSDELKERQAKKVERNILPRPT